MSTIEPGATSAPTPRRPVGLAVILGVLGLGLGAAAWHMAAEVRALATNGVRAEAQVVGVDQFQRRGVASYVPTFAFRTADGRLVRERSSETLSSNDEFAGRRQVTVIYDPKDPSSVRLASSVDGGVGALPWIFAALAAGCLGLAGFAMVAQPKTRARNASAAGAPPRPRGR